MTQNDKDPLIDLLLDADAAAPPSAAGADLARRVRTLQARRHARQRAIGVAAGAMVMVLLGCLAVLLAPGVEGVVPSDSAALAALARHLEAEADSKMLILEQMRQTERRLQAQRRARAMRANPDPAGRIERETERAALVIVFEADRCLTEANDALAAAKGYRQAIELFPDTNWAKAARSRLADLADLNNLNDS